MLERRPLTVIAADTATKVTLIDLAAQIRTEHEATTQAVRCGIEHAIAAGKLLLKAKNHRQMQHGQWLRWVKENCGLSVRTVQLYMRLYRHRKRFKCASLAHLGIENAAKLLASESPSAASKVQHVSVVVENKDKEIKTPYYVPAPTTEPATPPQNPPTPCPLLSPVAATLVRACIQLEEVDAVLAFIHGIKDPSDIVVAPDEFEEAARSVKRALAAARQRTGE
jgi:hypothetical protein